MLTYLFIAPNERISLFHMSDYVGKEQINTHRRGVGGDKSWDFLCSVSVQETFCAVHTVAIITAQT